MALASETEIEVFLAEHPGWTHLEKAVERTFEFENFVGSVGFVTTVALLSEKADHHPDIDIRWNRVTLTLSTHSEGGLTARDLDLADRCDNLA